MDDTSAVAQIVCAIMDGRTAVSVAARIEVDASLISRWRSGENTPTNARMRALLDACDASPELRARAWAALGVAASDLAGSEVGHADLG